MEGSVSVGCLDRTVCVKVEGRGTFQSSRGLKELIKKMIQRGYRDFIIDLKTCELMDSTFMGTLAGAALRLRELEHDGLQVVNANPRNRELLCGLGLDQIFEVSTEAPGVPMPATQQFDGGLDSTPTQRKEEVLEAHEALARADSANAVKFRDVIEFLRQELDSADGTEDKFSES